MSACQSLFWRETHAKGLCARSPTRPEEDEGKQSPRAEQKKPVNRREQSTKVWEGKVREGGDGKARSSDLWSQRPGWPT